MVPSNTSMEADELSPDPLRTSLEIYALKPPRSQSPIP